MTMLLIPESKIPGVLDDRHLIMTPLYFAMIAPIGVALITASLSVINSS